MTRVNGGLLREVLEANARYWAAEAFVIDAYWTWEGRSLETDLTWLARQCHKELVDGVFVRLDALRDAVVEPLALGGAALERATEGMRTEHAHLRAFAAVHDAWADPGCAPIDPATLPGLGWDENDQLMALRRRHRDEQPGLGPRAFAITEGGGGVLYVSGAGLAGRGGIDAAIASACAGVRADEQDHLVEGLDEMTLSDDELRLLGRLTVEQGRFRLPMRWSQFSGPIPVDQLEALMHDGAEPQMGLVDGVLEAAGLG